jgi:hypothetical protein
VHGKHGWVFSRFACSNINNPQFHILLSKTKWD